MCVSGGRAGGPPESAVIRRTAPHGCDIHSGREESRLIGRRCIRTLDPIWRRAKAGPGIGAGRDCKALRRSTNSWPSNSISTSGSTSRAYKRMDQDGRSGAVSWRQRKFKMAEETRERRRASAVRSLRMHGRVGLRHCRGVALGMAHGGKTRRHVCVDRQQGHRRELDHRRFVNRHLDLGYGYAAGRDCERSPASCSFKLDAVDLPPNALCPQRSVALESHTLAEHYPRRPSA